jgi:hypothetical protein
LSFTPKVFKKSADNMFVRLKTKEYIMTDMTPSPLVRKIREDMNTMFFNQLDTNGNNKLDADDRIDKAILQELGIVDANDKDTGKTISKASFIDYFSSIPGKIRNMMRKKAEQQEQPQEQQTDTVPQKKESLLDKFFKGKSIDA